LVAAERKEENASKANNSSAEGREKMGGCHVGGDRAS